MTVTVHDAKTNLSKLLQRVEKGEEVVIARGKTPVARLVSIKAQPPKRKFGAMKGQMRVTDAFFEPLPPGWDGLD
jgi:prevent-host-death family protein